MARLLAAFSPAKLPPETVKAHADRWRQVFARRVRELTGEWTYLGFDWHAFSEGYTNALESDEARSEYRRHQHEQEFVVLVGPVPSDGFGCQADTLPRFDGKNVDVYVVATDFSWTMVFTHEPNCGPYFATPDIVARPRQIPGRK